MFRRRLREEADEREPFAQLLSALRSQRRALVEDALEVGPLVRVAAEEDEQRLAVLGRVIVVREVDQVGHLPLRGRCVDGGVAGEFVLAGRGGGGVAGLSVTVVVIGGGGLATPAGASRDSGDRHLLLAVGQLPADARWLPPPSCLIHASM